MPNTTIEKTIEEAQSALTVKRAFGEPFEVDGLTILPAAQVGGAGGGGGANGNRGGWGTGFRVASRPMGVYVIDAEGARWVPVTMPNPLVSLLMTPVSVARALIFGRERFEERLRRVSATLAGAERKAGPARRARATVRSRAAHPRGARRVQPQ